ncbi:hypothetical protein DFJ58DRAFT_726319 [Suillus subalutaceus]|uniref:uncharacterized protein n=1 Tax=Suillus subalutaceus TaxID=48586 RepID=UPI001B87208E|nr:uncharacterized protein DFJ58DRAFT_726319 [Suillus subalutaceus]KAG1859613.1 hypothetical protein DFJ58DRAFT_726319 [Suillus subalutaceus]
MKELGVVDNQATEKYLRIASISIALYDYIITLPAEWRFYRSQSSFFRLRLACILFILIRYGSIIVMILSNYGVFSTGFTQETCKHYYMISPVFKVIQTMISQVILGVRTFNIARRDRRIGITLVVLYFISVSLEWFTNMFDRILYVNIPHNKIHANSVVFRERNPGKVLSAWLYYTVSMLYDLAVLTISTVYLLRYNPLSSRLEQLVRVLIYDGIGYFIVLTGSNILNIVLYHTSNIQTQAAGASIGFAVRTTPEFHCSYADARNFTRCVVLPLPMITYTELSEAETRRLDNVVAARYPQNARDVSAIRSPLTPKSHIDPEFGLRSFNGARTGDIELDICAYVEPLVTLDHTDECGVSSSWGNPMER